MWYKNYTQCKSCQSTEWLHKAKGYCSKCYPFIKALDDIKNWTLKNLPIAKPVKGLNNIDVSCINKNNLTKVKNDLERQYKGRLNVIRDSVKLKTFITGLQLEFMLERVAKHVSHTNGTKLFHSMASTYDSKINQQSRSYIFRELNVLLRERRFLVDKIKIYFE